MGNFTTSIDFGSSKTSVAVGQKKENGMSVVFWGSAPSEGVKYGEITNVTKCAKVLQGLLDRAGEAIGEPVTEALVSISGKNLETAEEKVGSKRPFPDRAISQNEIKDLTNRQYHNAAEGKTVLEVAPQQYNIDDNYNVAVNEIDGMSGHDIDVTFKNIIGKKSLVDTREQVLQLCGIKSLKYILSPIAASRAVLTGQELEKGVVLINFGKDLTEIAIVRDNIVRDVRVLPFAGESITKDIANVTAVSQSWAEIVKVRHGYCLEEICPENKTLELINADGDEDGEIDLLLLTRVIEARVSEIFDAVKYIVSNSKYAGRLNGGYVLTGGSAYLGYILPLAKTILGAKVRLAAPRGCLSAESESGAFDAGSCVAVGLILEQDEPLLSTSTAKIADAAADRPVKPGKKPAVKIEQAAKSERTEMEEEEFTDVNADELKEESSGGWWGILRHKSTGASKKQVKSSVEDENEVKAPQKPVESKKEKKSSLGNLFKDEDYGNQA